MSRTPIVLDVDTGVDDACALLLAALHPDLDLRAVTCVGGNAPLADVVRNTLTRARRLRARGRAGRRRGRPAAARGAASTRGTCTATTGWATSTGRASTREPDRAARRRAAARRAPRGRRADEPVTLVPLAPMTNIALLLRTYPDGRARDPADRVHGRRGARRQRHRLGRVQRLPRPGGGGDHAGRLRRPGHRAGDVRARRLLRPASRLDVARTWPRCTTAGRPGWPAG